MPDDNSLWLEVESVRTENGTKVDVKLKGDSSKERWWSVDAATPNFKNIMEALDGGHVVLAELGISDSGKLVVNKLRIERKETHVR